ncbi:MAG: hypothetical protein WCP53_16215, partial [Verrucomicrobiota bacterium]
DGTYSTVWAASDYTKSPRNSLSGGAPWPTTALHALAGGASAGRVFPIWTGTDTLKVTGTWGFGTAVPTMVTQATVIQAARIYKRADSPLGVAGFGDMGAIRVSRTDPDVYTLIRPFKKFGVA